MKLFQTMESSRTLNEKQWTEWSRTVFHLFYGELSCYLQDYEQKGKRFSVVIADIDNFKKVNDTYGHAFRDEVIKKVANLFNTHEVKGSFSARYNGEEFSMIIPNTDPLSVAEKIRSDFESFDFEISEGTKHFTLSIGAAVYDRKYSTASSFFEKADNALHKAKRNGKNQVILQDM